MDDPRVRRAAVAMVFREAPRGVELLFIRRAHDPRDPWSGQVGFPGGRVEPEDADLCATAMRETAEEVGLDLVAGGRYLGGLDEVRALARMRPVDLCIAPFAFRLNQAQEAAVGAEVASTHWLAVDRLLHPSASGMMDYVHEGRNMRFPCLRDEGLVIWGLTFRMFANLAELVRGLE